MVHYFLSIRRCCGFAAAAAVALFTAGCGEETSTVADAGGRISVETGSLSKADYVQQVDEICKETKDQFERGRAEFEKAAPGTELQFNRQTIGALVDAAIVPPYEEMIRKIRTLGAPSGEEEEVAAFLNAIQEDLDKASEHPIATFRAGEGTPFVETSKIAEEYGLRGCIETFR